MTRTRNQTTLTKLAQMLADINGEIAFNAGLVEHPLVKLFDGDLDRLLARRGVLVRDRAALVVTLRQFDPDIDPECIGESQSWLKTRCRKPLSRQATYLKRLADLVVFVSTRS
jgi:hypothetical protein